MAKHRSRQPYSITLTDRFVGLLVILAATALVVALVLRAQDIGPGAKKLHYYTVLQRSFGIIQGGDIRLSDISIGGIDQISLMDDGSVRVDIGVSERYAHFITEGSHLEIGTSMSLAAVLGSTGLTLVTNTESSSVLENGSFIETREPLDLGEILSEQEIGQVVNNIKILIENLKSVSETIQANQEVFARSILSMSEISLGLKNTVDSLPDMVDTVEKGFDTWRVAGRQVSEVVTDTGEDIRAVASNARISSEQINQLLAVLNRVTHRADRIVADIETGADELPALISDSHALVRSANDITDRINDHWLLGESRGKPVEVSAYLGHPSPTAPTPAAPRKSAALKPPGVQAAP
ncbi:MAG: MlaD family protein [Pseudomonadota bacterium]